jgi:hypothetical protein
MIAFSNDPEAERWRRHRAARVVALRARDAGEAAELLDMLGLTAAEGRFPPAPAGPEPVPAPRPPSDAERHLAASLLADVTEDLWSSGKAT